MLKLASILGQIGAVAGALSAFWLDVTSAQYHGGRPDVAGWGIGLFLLAALPLWIAARNVDAHTRLVSTLFVVCGVWLAVPSLWGLIDPALFIAPDYMIEPTDAPEGIQLVCAFLLASGLMLIAAGLLGFAAGVTRASRTTPAATP